MICIKFENVMEERRIFIFIKVEYVKGLHDRVETIRVKDVHIRYKTRVNTGCLYDQVNIIIAEKMN